MHHINFILVLIALSVLRLDAQREIAPSLRPYAAHWDSHLQDLFIEAGFNMGAVDAQSAPKPSVKRRSPVLRLDSTIEYVAYPDSLPLILHTFSYPQEDVYVDTEYGWQPQGWEPTTRIVTYTDDLGRKTEVIAYLYDPVLGDYVPNSRLELFPRGNSPELLDSFIASGWVTALGEYQRLISTSYVFDEFERVIEEITSLEYFEFPFYFRDYYTYDAEGRLVSIESFNDDGTTVLPAGLETYAYDGDFLVTWTSLMSDGLGGYVPQDRIDYAYNDAGLEDTIRTLAWDLEKETWQEVSQDAYQYDDEDRVIERNTLFLDQDGMAQRDRETFAYIQDDDLLVESDFAWDNGLPGWVLESRIWYYYEDIVSAIPDDPRPIGTLAMYPNPSPGQVQLTLGASRHTVSVFGLSGQLLRQVELPAGDHRLDLSTLPAGIYQVLARSEEGWFGGRIVIQP